MKQHNRARGCAVQALHRAQNNYTPLCVFKKKKFYSFFLFFIYFHLTGKALMTSVPPKLSTLGEIRDWVRTAMEASEKWQKMRVIVIGHGRIGKTSLIHTLQDSLVCKNEYQVLLCLFPC